jgi:hypothetical protein
VRIVPPTLPRPFGACASGEARGGERAHSDVGVTLVTALEALKDVHAALVAAQLAVQPTVRSVQVVAMPGAAEVLLVPSRPEALHRRLDAATLQVV